MQIWKWSRLVERYAYIEGVPTGLYLLVSITHWSYLHMREQASCMWKPPKVASALPHMQAGLHRRDGVP